MRDRTPTQVLQIGDKRAIRYAIYDEQGTFLRYEYMLAADEPTDEGTPLNKATLLTDETAAQIWPDAEKRPEDPTVNDALSVIQNEAGAVGTIKSTLRTDLGDDWLLCNGEPVPPQYPELIELLGGVKLDGVWNYKEDFEPGSYTDYFVVNNQVFTISYSSKLFYLHRVEFDGTVQKTLLRDMSTSTYGNPSWAYYDGKIYLMLSTTSGNGKFVVEYATFDGETLGAWATKTGDSTTFLGSGNGWSAKICGGKSGIYIFGNYETVVSLRFCTNINGPYTNLSISKPSVTASSNLTLSVSYSWFYDILQVLVSMSGYANKSFYLIRGSTHLGKDSNCRDGSYTVFNDRIYASVTDTDSTKVLYTAKIASASGYISSWTKLSGYTTVPGDFFEYKGQWYRVAGANKLTAVNATTTSPFYQDADAVIIEQDNAGKLAPKGAFLDCGDYLVAGPYSKFCIVPTISISGDAYTYMKAR